MAEVRPSGLPIREKSTKSLLRLGDPRPLAAIRGAVHARSDFLRALYVFAVTRACFIAATFFAVIMFSATFAGSHPSVGHDLLPAWDRWDTVWYTDIAQRGYDWHKGVGTYPTAFFPLYPLAIRLAHLVTGRSYLAVSLLVSNLCFLAALLLMHKLARWETNAPAANRAIIYIAVFPTAFFFFAGYTESLFLLVSVWSFYALRQRRWLVAGVAVALASSTRVTGILLILPLLYEYARDSNFHLREMLRVDVLGIAIAPAGLVAFMVYLGHSVGDPLAFVHNQAGWQKIFTLQLWSGVFESVRQILVVQPPISFFEAHNLLNLGLGAMMLVLTVLACRKLPASYSLYLIPFWIVTLAEPAMGGGYPVPLVSLARYIVVLFPVFMYLGVQAGETFHDAYLVGGTALMMTFTVAFIEGRWIV